jgi:2OG-Fe(II) oxygenase superfamily
MRPGLRLFMASFRTAIHEKPRAGAANEELSMLLHSVFGVNHYGGERYLAKLTTAELDRISEQLKSQLEVVERARASRTAHKEAAAVREKAAQRYMEEDFGFFLPLVNKPLYDALAPIAALPASAPIPSRLAGAALRQVTEEAEGVYSFQLFSPELCNQLLSASASFASSEAATEALTVASNKAQVPLHRIAGPFSGAAFEAFLRERIISPLSRLLYPSFASSIDWSYGYVIGYNAAPANSGETPKERGEAAGELPTALLARTGLHPHTDDSEVTLNVNLGVEGFVGGELLMHSLRDERTGHVGGARTTKAEPTMIAVKPGRAIIHAGQHGHEVLPVTKGERYSLIVWARDNGGYRARTCPCCLIHRRNVASGSGTSGGSGSYHADNITEGSCICDHTFN